MTYKTSSRFALPPRGTTKVPKNLSKPKLRSPFSDFTDAELDEILLDLDLDLDFE